MVEAGDVVVCDNCGKSFPEKKYGHKVFGGIQYLTCPACKFDFNRTTLIKKDKRSAARSKRK